ncbi:hypothetical protein JCM11251_001488 [Rhodosporidiobolus azoricus]
MSLSRRTASLFLPSPLTTPSPSSRLSPSPPPPLNKKGRLRKGTRAEDAFNTDPFSPPPRLSSFDSSFAVQEYIAALVRRDPHDVELITAIPPSAQDEPHDAAGEDVEEVELVDEDVWVYEQLRRITLDQHLWLAALSTPSFPGQAPPCTQSTCPEMRASDWLFLCAAHSHPPSPPCSAIDYSLHCSDGAQALLNSSRYFPSRLSVTENGRRLLDAVARRLYRSFAHAFFHHPSHFAILETDTSLVRRFIALNRRFGMVEEDGLIIPELELEEGFALEQEWEGRRGNGSDGSEEDEEDGEEGGIREVKREDV